MVVGCDSSGGGGGATNSYAGKTIKLGADLSVTGAGILTGVQSRNGMQLAVDQINKAGGVLGAKIVLQANDDPSDPAQSAPPPRTQYRQEPNPPPPAPPPSPPPQVAPPTAP